MKLRVTNNSEIDLDDVSAVFPTPTGFRVVFKDGGATSYRRVQLTPAARVELKDMTLEER